MSETFSTTVIGSAGTTIALSGTLTPAAAPPVITPPPVVTPPIVIPPTSQVVFPASDVPGWPGMVYGSDTWPNAPKDAYGQYDLTEFVKAVTPVYVSPATGAAVSRPGDYHDFRTAQAAAIKNGSNAVGFYRGNKYGPSECNNNIIMSGALSQPAMVFACGADGMPQTFDNAAPQLAGGARLCNYVGPGSPIKYFIMQGIAASNTTSPGTGGSAFGLVDTNCGIASGPLAWLNCEADGYAWALDVEADDPLGYQFNTVVVQGCNFHDNFGGSTVGGAYFYGCRDLHITGNWIIGNGRKTTLGAAHGIYLNYPYGLTTDPQLRIDNNFFIANAACACEANCGALYRYNASLATPIGPYGGGGAQAGIDFLVVDGGSGEFDLTKVVFASQFTTSGAMLPQLAGGALSLQPGAPGNPWRGWGAFLDCATTGYMHDYWAIGKTDAGDIPNSGFAAAVRTIDAGKPSMPSEATNATVGPNVFGSWYCTTGNFGVALSQSGPPQPVITLVQPVDLPSGSSPSGITYIKGLFDATRTVSAYAKTLTETYPDVVDGPSFANHCRNMALQGSGLDPKFTAKAYTQWAMGGVE